MTCLHRDGGFNKVEVSVMSVTNCRVTSKLLTTRGKVSNLFNMITQVCSKLENIFSEMFVCQTGSSARTELCLSAALFC